MKSIKKLLGAACSAATLALTLTTANVEGSGFSILEQSTAGLGRALAGMTCDINEPSAVFFNPSLSAWHERPAFNLGGNWLHVSATAHKNSKNTAAGDCGNDGGGWSHVPNFDLVYPVTDKIALGLAFSATSGTATKWNPKWVGRFQSIDTELSVVEATPSISYKILDNLSIGAGLIVQYADIEMTRYNYPIGHLKLKGDSYALGYIAGLTYQPFEKTQVGLSYRSRMTQELELEGRLTETPFGTLRGDADADLDLPAVANFGITQGITDKWEVMMDLSWTKASVFDELSITFDKKSKLGQMAYQTTGSYKQTEVMKWKDTWRIAFGTEYKLTDKWTVRCGTAFDRTPATEPELRSSTLPDLNRYWLSAGVSYQWNEHLRFDLSYVRIVFEKGEWRMTLPDGSVASCQLGCSTDIISYALTYTF